jgi:hypothetical protein
MVHNHKRRRLFVLNVIPRSSQYDNFESRRAAGTAPPALPIKALRGVPLIAPYNYLYLLYFYYGSIARRNSQNSDAALISPLFRKYCSGTLLSPPTILVTSDDRFRRSSEIAIVTGDVIGCWLPVGRLADPGHRI